MNFVIPMAGAGSRFAAAGYTLPKPLIPVRGEAMYRWAVSSLKLNLATRLIFILRDGEHTAALAADIEATFKAQRPAVLVIDHLTRGQAETVYLARELIDLDRPTLVHNSDTAFTSDDGAWDFGLDDGVLHTFDSTEPRWSYARADDSGRVVEVAEKRVISRFASTGTYYFRDSRRLFKDLKSNVDSHDGGAGEMYLAPLYNDLIRDKLRVSIRAVRQNLCFGTPHDLEVTRGILDADSITRERLVARRG